MDRTLVLNIQPTPEQASILKRTLDMHTACFNTVAREGFTTASSNGVELHKRTYYPLRAQYPDFPSQFVYADRVKATDAVNSALTWKDKTDKVYRTKAAKSLI